jgi:hypothetical protein
LAKEEEVMSKDVLAGIEPKQVVELGEYVVDYDETIAAKLAAVTDPKAIGRRTDWATDEKFPDTQEGKKRYRASAVYPGQYIAQDALEGWCRKNKKILATSKPGIDLARISPHPNKLDEMMPLALAGQFFVNADDDRSALYFYRDGVQRFLDYVWLAPDEKWHDLWWFLVLEELPLEA